MTVGYCDKVSLTAISVQLYASPYINGRCRPIEEMVSIVVRLFTEISSGDFLLYFGTNTRKYW